MPKTQTPYQKDKTRHVVALAVLLLSVSIVRHASAEDAAAPAAEAEVKAPVLEEDELSQFGLMLDAGLPDGVNLAAVYRPWYWLRAHAGMGYNMIAPGFRGGVSLIAFDYWVTPTLVLEAGQYLEGDASKWVGQLTSGGGESAILQRISYRYAHAHLGLEFGSDNFTFYIHGGPVLLDTTLRTKDQSFGDQLAFKDDTNISVKLPLSAKLGFIVYLF